MSLGHLGGSARSLGGSALFFGCAVLFLGSSALGSDKRVLSLLVPLEMIQTDLLNQFESEAKVFVRSGFLGTAADTDLAVRQGSTVWDVVISDELQLRKLIKIEKLFKLGSLPAAHGSSASGTASSLAVENGPKGASAVQGNSPPGAAPVYYQLLFNDPVGLVCKIPSGARVPELSWNNLSDGLVQAGLTGEVVLGVSLQVKALLANALNAGPRGSIEERIVFENNRVESDPRIAWLHKLHWMTRLPRGSLQAEILKDSVSCVVTFMSKYKNMQKFIAARSQKKISQNATEQLTFIVPSNRSIVRRFGIAVTEESSRLELALRFLRFALARKNELAENSGMCPEDETSRSEGAQKGALCSFKILDVITDFPVLNEKMHEYFENLPAPKTKEHREEESHP